MSDKFFRGHFWCKRRRSKYFWCQTNLKTGKITSDNFAGCAGLSQNGTEVFGDRTEERVRGVKKSGFSKGVCGVFEAEVRTCADGGVCGRLWA